MQSTDFWIRFEWDCETSIWEIGTAIGVAMPFSISSCMHFSKDDRSVLLREFINAPEPRGWKFEIEIQFPNRLEQLPTISSYTLFTVVFLRR